MGVARRAIPGRVRRRVHRRAARAPRSRLAQSRGRMKLLLPALRSPFAVHAFKWTLGAALLLPQSVLLGMTFPLMTGGVLRARPERPGYAIAMLYFTNSLGAGIGVLASGFYFIEAAGLPGTLTIAGTLNLVVAAAVVLLRRGASQAPSAEAQTKGVRVP